MIIIQLNCNKNLSKIHMLFSDGKKSCIKNVLFELSPPLNEQENHPSIHPKWLLWFVGSDVI